MYNSVIKLSITDDICLVQIGKISDNKVLADIITYLNNSKIKFLIISQTSIEKIKFSGILIEISICDICDFLKVIGELKKVYGELKVELYSECTKFSFKTPEYRFLADVLEILYKNEILIRAVKINENSTDIYFAERFSDKIFELVTNYYNFEII